MAKYFVTGATGFIGSEIVKQLIGRGHKVVALVRSPGKSVMLKALGVEIHAVDAGHGRREAFTSRVGTRWASKTLSPIKSTSMARAMS